MEIHYVPGGGHRTVIGAEGGSKLKTMKEVLQSIAGFPISKMRSYRKGSTKKLSASAAIQLAYEGIVDMESPESILGQVNLRSLLNRATFTKLPPEYQYKLAQLLPQVDRAFDVKTRHFKYVLMQIKDEPYDDDSNLFRFCFTRLFRVIHSALNNEFFAKACQEWKERLLRGDFTLESIQKTKSDVEKDRVNVDHWKV